MKFFLPFFITLIISLGLSTSHAVSFPQKDPQAFDVQAYLGLWYDYARTPNSFQDNTPHVDGEELSACVNSTAEYKLYNEKTIALVNTCFRKNSAGDLIKSDISGHAKVVKDSNGTQLKVAFGGVIARFFQRLFGSGKYWIYALGDKNQQGQYPWALVSGPDKDYIFVLTRKAKISPQMENEILKAARSVELPVEELVFDRDRL